MFLLFGLLFAVLMLIISAKVKGIGKKIFIGWIIASWVFVIVFGLIPVPSSGGNLICLICDNIGMPTSGTFDEILTWAWHYQILFAIGGLLFLTCPFTIVLGVLIVVSGGFGEVKKIFHVDGD